MAQLLSRDEFREGVFKRDHDKCVVCGSPAADAHHILERKLWDDGGYYLENGASLCQRHHIEAEQTKLSCDQLRELCGIKEVLLPGHLYDEFQYDKWGNILMPSGGRVKGELFYDESVQKILGEGGVLHLFQPYVKYPRTHHLPWSTPSEDDRVMPDLSAFQGQEVVATVKMDGEQTSIYADRVHARSLDMVTGQEHSIIKGIHAQIAHEIPANWRVCGENLYIKHSIQYQNLKAFFYVFSVWNERNECLSWQETEEWAALLGFPTVPVLYKGTWDEEKIKKLWTPSYDGDEMEGYVVRPAGAFPFSQFRRVVAKFVRPGHNKLVEHGVRILKPNRLGGQI